MKNTVIFIFFIVLNSLETDLEMMTGTELKFGLNTKFFFSENVAVVLVDVKVPGS